MRENSRIEFLKLPSTDTENVCAKQILRVRTLSMLLLVDLEHINDRKQKNL